MPTSADMILASLIVAGRIVPPIAQCAKQFPVAMLQTLAPQPPQRRDSGIFFMPVTDWDRTIGARTCRSNLHPAPGLADVHCTIQVTGSGAHSLRWVISVIAAVHGGRLEEPGEPTRKQAREQRAIAPTAQARSR